MSSGPNLWWVFDPETESFGTLPTGPFMVPALIIAVFLYVAKAATTKQHTHESIAGPIAQTERWKKKRQRYKELVKLYVEKNGDVTLYEQNEIYKLEKYLRDPW